VGLDLTPELMAEGARLAAQAGVEVEWIEGDMESLPFDGGSFDAVVSILGASSAPRHHVVADELVRVLRPGGRLVLCEWTHDGLMSRILATVARYLPPAPPFAMPPGLWGDEGHVRGLFAGAPIDLDFERGILELPPFDSPRADVEFHATRFGPLVRARSLAEADGRWPALRAELVPLHAAHTAVEYLVTVGRRH
jgi:SAM-dependent methyltransferase